jgi:hypothetical protein
MRETAMNAKIESPEETGGLLSGKFCVVRAFASSREPFLPRP